MERGETGPKAALRSGSFEIVVEEVAVVCAWCTSPVSGAGSRISHGICVDCAMGFLKKLPREYLQSIAEPDGTVTLFSGHKLQVPAEDSAG